jgi:putative peptidoglycan lipid II flippase
MPFMIDIFAPGFSDSPEKYQLSITLSRIAFPFLLSTALTSFFGSILNTIGHFEPYALTPIILNTSIIISLILFSQVFPTAAHAAAWGVCASGVIQLLFL